MATGKVRDYPELRAEVRRWAELQDGQRILLTTPSVLVGYRVEVYRAEGTTQWYTAVIVGYNEATRVSLLFTYSTIPAVPVWLVSSDLSERNCLLLTAM